MLVRHFIRWLVADSKLIITMWKPEMNTGSPGAAGNVGGYNRFWLDFGERAASIDGKFRTSIITDPSNGRQPARTAQAVGPL